MKKIISTVFTTLLFIGFSFSQEFTPMKSPEATAFLNANYLPMNESTGKMNITIPIYTIDLDGLSIPISLSYDTGGVKVNATASSVGLNWTLNASGLISKEVIGSSDTKATSIQNDIAPSGRVYIEYGYLAPLFGLNDFPVIEAYRDTQPDLFYAMAPGLSSKFTHRTDGTSFELSNNANRIESPFNNVPNPYAEKSFNYKFKFNITSSKGFVYSFKEKEYNKTYTRLREQDNDYHPLTDNLALPIWPVDFTEQQANDFLNNPYFTTNNTQTTSLIHLSSIKSPMSKKTVQYFYEDTFIVDNNRRIERSLDTYNVVGQVNFEHDFSKTKTLKKIVFPSGVIDFFYEENRLDIRGGKILKKIEIRNNQGVFIKGVTFEQSYFNAIENCNENHCYRLRLDEIKILDKNQNVLPGYQFDYNSNKLPKRFSVDQDFMGYYNGSSGIDEKQYFPKSYYKAGQGKKSIIPFPFSGYTMMQGGNASKVPNLNDAKAASLYKIVYPTGGYTIFDFELHTFNFSNTTVNSGGLRLKSQSLYESDATLQRKIDYEYNLANGKSSGSITNLPLFSKASVSTTVGHLNYTPVTTQVSNTKLELTNGSYVTYGRVKSTEQNNGYTINTYTNALDYPNLTPSNYSMHGTSSTAPNWFREAIGKGYLLSAYNDFSIKRTRPLSSEVFDQQNRLLKSTVNGYEYAAYNTFNVDQRILTYRPNLSYSDGSNAGYAKFNISLASASFHLKNSIEKHYSSSGIITNEKEYLYTPSNPFIKEAQTIVNKGEIMKEKYIYPFDSEASSIPNSAQLNALNLLFPLQTTYYEDTHLVRSSTTTFHDYGNDKILPQNLKIAKGSNPLTIKKEFYNYDKRGNSTEYAEKDGVHITVLWGYRYQYKIAEIVGATLSEVLSALNINSTEELQNLSNATLKTTLNTLRTALPNAQVYSYIHTPLVGVAEITNPNGITEFYNYDSFHRLQSVKDKNNKIVKHNLYNYKQSPIAGNVHQESLQVEIKKRPTDFYKPVASAATHKTVVAAFVKGGNGDYKYEWKFASSSTVLADEYDYTIEIPCGQNRTLQVTVTDDNNTQITKTVTVYAAKCGEPFYVGNILGSSTTNNQNNFWVNTEGGSYDFSYQWFIAGGSPTDDALSYNDHKYPQSSGLLFNNSGNPITVNLSVKVTDVESGLFVTRTRSVVIQPEFEINSCFVAGTKITMANGTQKNIEEVIVGDKVLTYNLKERKTAISSVEKITSPEHTQLIRFVFENRIENTNTLDHPYYVKGKGWASYAPKETQVKYKLRASKIAIGDVVLHYNTTTKKIEEIKLIHQERITKTQQTFNLDKVRKNHNFFANGILVHNKSSENTLLTSEIDKN